ncbi:MAG TPA: AraC family transcriptional regulator [Flavilitoribacter sp.]|nr:AraC family transcriptional regulator [Flavilitoribacter sp.]
MPTPAAEGTPAPFAAVTGPKNKPVGLKFGRDYLMIKVAFQPTGLYRLLNIPMQKTANRGLNAADFFSGETALIHQQLERSESYDEMFALVSEFMDRQIAKGYQPEDSLDRVAIKMLDPFAKNSLPEWASMACLSLRQFERNFTSRVGISPKTYLRIVRFENAMKVKNQSPEKSWSEIAYECDYDDSSHLLREFRQFAEFPPGKLMHQQTSGYGDFPSG